MPAVFRSLGVLTEYDSVARLAGAALRRSRCLKLPAERSTSRRGRPGSHRRRLPSGRRLSPRWV